MLYVPRRNPLAFPAGHKPGFNPNHPAAGGIVRFSAVPLADSGRFVNLLNGRTPDGATGALFTIDAKLGPSQNYDNNDNVATVFNNMSTANDADCTFACIRIMNGVAGSNANRFFSTGIPDSIGWLFETYTPGSINSLVALAGGSGYAQTTVLETLSYLPYFIAMSCTNGVANFVLRRLDTGAISSEVVSFTYTTTASTGNYTIGNAYIGGNIYAGNNNMGPLMFSNKYNPLPALLQWAADPWSFWYPRQRQNWVGVAATLRHRISWAGISG